MPRVAPPDPVPVSGRGGRALNPVEDPAGRGTRERLPKVLLVRSEDRLYDGAKYIFSTILFKSHHVCTWFVP